MKILLEFHPLLNFSTTILYFVLRFYMSIDICQRAMLAKYNVHCISLSLIRNQSIDWKLEKYAKYEDLWNRSSIGTLWVISQELPDEFFLYLAYARIYIRGTCRPNMMLIESIIDWLIIDQLTIPPHVFALLGHFCLISQKLPDEFFLFFVWMCI